MQIVPGLPTVSQSKGTLGGACVSERMATRCVAMLGNYAELEELGSF